MSRWLHGLVVFLLCIGCARSGLADAGAGEQSMVSQVSPSQAATVAVRLHWYKKILADSGLQDALIRAAYERGFVLCAVEPAQASVKKPAFEIPEALFSREGFDRASCDFRSYLDDIETYANLRKVTLSQGGEAIISRRAAQLAPLS